MDLLGDMFCDDANDSSDDSVMDEDDTLVMSQVWHGDDIDMDEVHREAEFPDEPSQELSATPEGSFADQAQMSHEKVNAVMSPEKEMVPASAEAPMLVDIQTVSMDPNSNVQVETPSKKRRNRRVSFGGQSELTSSPTCIPATPPSQVKRRRTDSPTSSADQHEDIGEKPLTLTLNDSSKYLTNLEANVLYQLAFMSPPTSPPQLIDLPCPASPSVKNPQPRGVVSKSIALSLPVVSEEPTPESPRLMKTPDSLGLSQSPMLFTSPAETVVDSSSRAYSMFERSPFAVSLKEQASVSPRSIPSVQASQPHQFSSSASYCFRFKQKGTQMAWAALTTMKPQPWKNWTRLQLQLACLL